MARRAIDAVNSRLTEPRKNSIFVLSLEITPLVGNSPSSEPDTSAANIAAG
jgi:hypothetical protein